MAVTFRNKVATVTGRSVGEARATIDNRGKDI